MLEEREKVVLTLKKAGCGECESVRATLRSVVKVERQAER